jgi:hypothetical protein
MGTFSNQKRNTCSHLKKERYLPINIFKTLLLSISSSGDSYRPLLKIYALQVHAMESGNSQSPNKRYGLQKRL